MLRYKVNILLELKSAGYNTTRLRREKILSESTLQRIREGNTSVTLESIGESTIQKLRTGNTSINLGSLEIVCDILHCQPGDLVEWVEDA